MKAQVKRLVRLRGLVGHKRAKSTPTPLVATLPPVSTPATKTGAAGQVALASAWAHFEAVGWDEV